MVPRKSKELISNTVSITGSDEELVSDFLAYYWTEVRKALTELRDHHILVDYFGTFIIKPTRLHDMLVKYNEIATHMEPATFKKCQMINDLQNRISTLKNVERLLTEQEEKFQEIKSKRHGKETH